MVKRCILAMLTLLLLSVATPARASLFADFWATDVDGGGVTLDFSLFTTPGTFWFSSDSTNWFLLANATDPFSVITNSLTMADTTHVFLRMDPLQTMVTTLAAASAAATEPTMIYSGADGDGLYNSLAIQWSGSGTPFSISLITPAGGDAVGKMSAVPLPNVAFLFCSGLIGFIAVKRKARHMAS